MDIGHLLEIMTLSLGQEERISSEERLDVVDLNDYRNDGFAFTETFKGNL